MKFRQFVLLFAITCLLLTTGCWKPYNSPEFENVGANESAFLLPRKGDTTKQASFYSEEYLKKKMIAVKRIQITKEWEQTGRWSWYGHWEPNVMLIKVSRAPVTREWTTGTKRGTSKNDQGIWAESRDSVGFSTGIVISAMINESSAPLFLHKYRSGSLTSVMDTEIRCRIQSVFSDVAGKYDMSELRGKKTEIIATIRTNVMPYFKERGINITTIGITNGFTYKNEQIQDGIDKVFLAQREKEISAAQLEAQEDKNKRILSETKTLAAKELQLAQAKATAQEMILAVATKAAKNPVFMELKKLESKDKHTAKWDGAYPRFMVGGSQGMMMNVSAKDIMGEN